jgi:hypothetical protein
MESEKLDERERIYRNAGESCDRSGTQRLRHSVGAALSFVLLVTPAVAPLASMVTDIADLAEIV